MYTYEKTGESAKFKVPSTIQPATYIMAMFLFLGFTRWNLLIWVGLFIGIFVGIEYLLNRTNAPFSVSPSGINSKDNFIPIERIDSIDIRNSQSGNITDKFLVDANFTNVATNAGSSFMQRYYFVVSILHSGGKRTKLAGGLKIDTATSLVADIKRGLAGELR